MAHFYRVSHKIDDFLTSIVDIRISVNRTRVFANFCLLNLNCQLAIHAYLRELYMIDAVSTVCVR